MPRYTVDVWTVFGWERVEATAETPEEVVRRVYANNVSPQLDPAPCDLGLTIEQFARRVRPCGQVLAAKEPEVIGTIIPA